MYIEVSIKSLQSKAQKGSNLLLTFTMQIKITFQDEVRSQRRKTVSHYIVKRDASLHLD